ncbi:DUF2281 domain-containing protein [Nostoc sp. FACHB-110]|uniref:DUF2281 domain-containing protein n=1 Tax=Nostoc sp. FACHB-110 TaxID=2692834 RepID=UPI0016843DB7|nr:DUF2281 domain-containing protein [Nostoc sp. FACHB-110]MBD2436299.1 DUF2281 domain-containing protein [Nostoc sp. FACHB-110]
MDSLKEKIVGKLEQLPENKLQEVLNFVEFLEWRKANYKELTESQNEQVEEECFTEYVEGVLVVHTQSPNNWENAVHDLREERIQKFTSW